MNEKYLFSYDGLWHLLIDHKMKKKDLIDRAGLTTNVVAKMGKGEPVGLESIAKICDALECTVSDIVRYISDSDEKPKS